jgi:hypothetical protein
MTNKLVVIINSLKYQKLRKFYYMKWNSLYQITAASRTPDFGATAPRSPFSLSSVLNWICWHPPLPEKNPGYATGEFVTLRSRSTNVWWCTENIGLLLIAKLRILSLWFIWNSSISHTVVERVMQIWYRGQKVLACVLILCKGFSS